MNVNINRLKISTKAFSSVVYKLSLGRKKGAGISLLKLVTVVVSLSDGAVHLWILCAKNEMWPRVKAHLHRTYLVVKQKPIHSSVVLSPSVCSVWRMMSFQNSSGAFVKAARGVIGFFFPFCGVPAYHISRHV